MNRIATNSPRRTTVAAKLDLHDDNQRRLHDLIERMHGGRRPILRALRMRQIDDVIFEAVQWPRMVTPRFSVIEWQPDGLGLRWKDAQSARAALTMLSALHGPSRNLRSGRSLGQGADADR